MASHISSAGHFAVTNSREVTPATSQEEIDTTTDGALQQVCQRIINNERITAGKSASEGGKLFAPKAIAYKLGARRFNHRGNLAYNVLDYMTCPPEKLAVIRYAVGKGVMRMIRLAQTENAD